MEICLIGIGMGNKVSMTFEAEQRLTAADIVLGAARLIESLPKREDCEYLACSLPADIERQIRDNPQWGNVCVVLSGDSGFYSGANKIKSLLSDMTLQSIPGISSVQEFAAKLGQPWQDFRLVSAHAGRCDILSEVLNHHAVFFLLGRQLNVTSICDELIHAGLLQAKLTVGENLGSDEEKITTGTPEELRHMDFALLSVVLVENEQTFTRKIISPGIADSKFIRGAVPMTKRELRANIISLLEIREDEVLWDIGAGTGSVSIEMALLARRGKVYAIEQENEACKLIRKNREKFGAYNLTVVEGVAPAVLGTLATPDAVFIGGSNGHLAEILAFIVKQNPYARIVISAITLETLRLATEILEDLGCKNVDVVQIAVNRTKPVGDTHMFQAQNPIFLIRGGSDEN